MAHGGVVYGQQGPRLINCLEQSGINATDINKLKEAGMHTVDAVRGTRGAARART
jgi:hypothetical protein